MVEKTSRFLNRPVPVPEPESVPLSLYVHWPWCVHKCPYCDFNSRACPGGLPEDDYIDCLLKDLDGELQWVQRREVRTVYLGGGTPSLMRPESASRLLSGIRSRMPLAPGCEISMEANPGAVASGRLGAFSEAGINRLSVGVQSFQDPQLRLLGRIHTSRQAEETLGEVRRCFPNWNLDLMFGLPGEDLELLKEDLSRAVGCGSTHLSVYQLTIEQGTAFARRPPPGLPDPDELCDMADAVVSILGRAGFRRYEVSGYAQEGRQCRHNLNYWQYGDYLAIGAGAHGKVSTKKGVLRFAKHSSPGRYMDSVRRGQGPAHSRWVADRQLPFEFMLDALRLTDGVPRVYFESRTGLREEAIGPELDEARHRGLLADAGDRFRATEKGLDFLSDLQEIFLI